MTPPVVPTSAEISTTLKLILVIAETIREASPVPNGVLYAQLTDVLSLRAYTGIITILKNANLITEKSHELTWIGPARPFRPEDLSR